MKISDALQRLHWRISNGQFKPNQKDAEAFNFIFEWVTREKEKTLKQQQLFAKIYIIYLTELVSHYQDVSFASEEVHRQLSKPTNMHTELFRSRLNASEMKKLHEKIGISHKHPMLLTDEEYAEEQKIIEDNQKELLQQIHKWDIEVVEKSLQNQITEAVNRYKNLL